MQEEENGGGVSLGEIVRLICKKIWIVLIATVLAALASALIVHFAVSPAVASYSMVFQINGPAGSVQRYPDGSLFYYQDIISLPALEEAKTVAGLNKLNVEEMYSKEKISVSEERISGTAENGTVRYTLTAKGNCFSSAKEAAAFLRAVAEGPERKILAMADSLGYDLDEEVFEGASFSVKLDLLLAQKESIVKQYDEWTQSLSGSYRVTVGETSRSLFIYSSEAYSAFDEEKSLRDTLAQYDFHTADEATERASLTAEYKANLRKIEKLRETAGIPSAAQVQARISVEENGGINIQYPEPELTVDQQLQKLIVRNEDIVTLLGKYDEGTGTFDGTGTLSSALAAFTESLGRQHAELGQIAQTAGQVSAAIYRQSTQTDCRRVRETGGVSSVLVAIVCAVIVFIIASAAVYFAERKKAKALPQAAEKPQAEEKGAQENEEK